jgi:hypothetical protein
VAFMRRTIFPKDIRAVVWLAAALCSVSVLCGAEDKASSTGQGQASPQTSSQISADAGIYVKVQLDSRVKLSKLKPGDVVEGKLARDVYSSDRELFPAGSEVRLPVDHMDKRRRERNDHWPWVIKAFTPRHEKFPAFKTATVSAGAVQSTLQVSLVSVNWKREVHAQVKKKKPGEPSSGSVEVSKKGGLYASEKMAAPIMVLEASPQQTALTGNSEGTASYTPDMSALEALSAGTSAKMLLLGEVSASKSNPGDVVQGRLLEPVTMNSRVVLPAGTLIEGSVVKRTPPRWGSRAGSLALTFTGLKLPGGNRIPIEASLAGAELDRRSHTKIDPEGQLHGEHPGKAWMAINIGVTAGIAKEADDTLQLIIEAFVSTATDASTAGVGRIAATIASGIFLVTRHGRDVVIPRFTEMDIALDRPVSITKAAVKSAPVPAGGGN